MEKQSSSNPEENSNIEKEIQPEIIETVEGLDILTVEDRINLLLVFSGLKSAATIDVVENWQERDAQEMQESKDQIERLETSLKVSGVAFDSPGIESVKLFEYDQVSISIGNTKEDLELLIKAIESNNPDLIGRAYGFPSTSIEAFTGKRKRLNRKNLPKEVRESDGLAFCFFILSKDNWEEEIKQGKRNADYIKKISPYLYEKIMKYNKGKK